MIHTLKPLVLATCAGLLILGAAGLSIRPIMAADPALRGQVGVRAPVIDAALFWALGPTAS